jgi:hypothetical protein
MRRISQSDVTPCYWPFPSSYLLYLGRAVWYEAMGQGLVYRLWLYTEH